MAEDRGSLSRRLLAAMLQYRTPTPATTAATPTLPGEAHAPDGADQQPISSEVEAHLADLVSQIVVPEAMLHTYYSALINQAEHTWSENVNEFYDYVSRVSPTSPLRERGDGGVTEVSADKMKQAFQEVNPSIVAPILEWLAPEDLCVLACVSKKWNEEASHNYHWRKLFQRYYSGVKIPEDRQFEPGFIKKFFAECTPRVGDVLEVVDTVRKWVVCRVIAVLNRTLFLVYFEGWSETYIMWVDKVRDAPRIRPVHPRYLTGLGAKGPLTEAEFQRFATGAKFTLSHPRIEWPIPPCSYLPAVYFNNHELLAPQHPSTYVRDRERIRRLNEPRHPRFEAAPALQSKSPAWVTEFPKKTDEPFYGPHCRVNHLYRHDPYPEEQGN